MLLQTDGSWNCPNNPKEPAVSCGAHLDFLSHPRWSEENRKVQSCQGRCTRVSHSEFLVYIYKDAHDMCHEVNMQNLSLSYCIWVSFVTNFSSLKLETFVLEYGGKKRKNYFFTFNYEPKFRLSVVSYWKSRCLRHVEPGWFIQYLCS